MGVSIRSGCYQFVVEVAANERHEGAASGMDPANRQLSGQVGNLRVLAGQNLQLQLAWALMARSACSFPNRAALGLPRLSTPNKTSGVEQVVAGVEGFAFAVMISTPWNQKGTRSGSLGFMGTARSFGL